MFDVTSDARFLFRRAARRPVVPLVTTATIALGVAAVVSVFAAVDTVLLQPLPLSDSNRLVRLYTALDDAGSVSSVNYFDLRDLSDDAESLTAIAPYTTGGSVWRTEAGPRPLSLAYVGRTYLDVLGLRVAAGRWFAPEDFAPGAQVVAVATHAFFETAFGGAAESLDRPLDLDGRIVRIVGVLPKTTFLHPTGRDLWLPLVITDDSYLNNRQSVALAALGRIRSDRDLEAAQTEVAAITARLQTAYPDTTGRRGAIVLQRLATTIAGPVESTLSLLAAIVSVMLLIAGANVANLLMADAVAREREFAIRSAVGGGRWRLTRQVAVESALMSAAGGVAGILLAPLLLDRLISDYPVDLPRVAEIGIGSRSLLVAGLAAGIAGGLAALPLARAIGRARRSGAAQGSARDTGGRRSVRVASGLVVAQVGVSLALVSAGALLVSTFLQTAAVETGLVPEGVLTFRVTAASERYGSRDALLDFLDQLEQRIDGLPGVRSAGLSGFLPLAPGIWSDNFARVGTSDAPPDLPAARMQFITPALTAALGIDLVAGRGFAVTDRAGAPPVALVSEGLATRYFDGAAVGREIDWQGGRRRIVGVLADTLQDGLHEPPEPTLYLPLAQYPRASVWVVARTGAEPLALLPAARDALRAIDPFVLAATPGTLEARIDEAMAPERFRAGLASAIGVVAAALAALGLYGVLAQSVAMRRSEIGIRMALGASATGVRRSIIRRALGLTGAGLGLGVVLSASTSRLLQGFLVPGVAPLDAGVLAAVAVVLSLLAVAAAWLPARQASRVDPLHVLRAD